MLVIGAACFAGLGLAAAALIRSAEAVAAVVNVIVLPMSFLSGAFGTTDNLPAALELVADVLPLKYLIELVLATYVDGDAALEAPRRDRRHGGLGRRRLPRRPRPLRLGAARALEDFRSGVLPLAMQNLAQIAFLDEDGDIRINFGMFAGREATRAEIDELASALLEEVDAITIVAEQRTIADREMEASVHQIRVELGDETTRSGRS